MGRLLVTLATILALVLAAAFVVPAFTDWNAYRTDIEHAASAILGRDIAIGGAIDIVLLPEPHLRAAKVEAEGGSADGARMTAEAVDLSLSLQALLSGRIEASKLRLVRPFLILDLSKPLQNRLPPAQASAMSTIAAGVSSLEIEGGRVSVLQDASRSGAFTLTNIDGALSAPAPGNAYRFNGRVSQEDRRFEVRFYAAPAPKSGVKLTGSVLDLASRIAFQADGTLSAAKAPVFEGAVAMTAPQAAALPGAAFDLQAKALAKIDFSGASFTDLAVTMDSDNRPQVLTGAAALGFAARTADIALQARSLDADALLASASGGALAPAPAGSGNRYQDAAARLLWLYPDFAVRLSLGADQVQFRGEPIEGVKVQGARTGDTWVFEEAKAKLPGETEAKASGSLTKTGGKPALLAEAAFQGKNLGRLNRWIASDAASARIGPARAFAAKGSLTLSEDIAAFTNVTGEVDGTPFTALLRLERAPARRLEVSLAGESFDLSGVDTGANALSAESVRSAWQAGLQQLSPLIGETSTIDSAEIDVTATAIKASFIDAKNVAVRLKFNQDLLTVAKLSLETPEGLSLSAEGAIPLRGAGQGRLDGRLEARAPQALLRAAALLGYDAESLQGRRLEEFAPASLLVRYSAEAQSGSAMAQVSGALGAARVEGRAQLKGALAEWRAGQLSAQIDISAPQGNKLVSVLFPAAAPAPGAPASPGALTLRAEGASERYAVACSLKSAPLQAQLDGAAELKGQSFAFSGRAQAASPAPEEFLPPSLLALLGGEPKTGFRVEADLSLAPGQIAATKLKAESPQNLVMGRLSVASSDRSKRIEADLKAGQLSAPALFNSLLKPPADGLLQASLAPAPSELWSGQPFALDVFQNATANLTLSAKTLKLGETFALSDAQISAKLENGRLDVRRFEGKALGGDLAATLSLDAHGGGAVLADARVSLSGADLSALPVAGSPAIATGNASLALRASGQGLSPRGLIAVLQGRGAILLSDGQLLKFAPAALQRGAEELLASPLPLTEDAVKKKASEAAQSADLRFHHLAIPVAIRGGMLEAPRASFRGRDGTVRMEAFVDLSSFQADTAWQIGVKSDARAKWPPVKIQIGGPLRELGSKPRSLSAEDFVRAVLIRKMEGDIARLESLNKPQTAPAEQSKPARRKRVQEAAPSAQQAAPLAGPTDFEKRMRDALQPKSPPRPDAQ